MSNVNDASAIRHISVTRKSASKAMSEVKPHKDGAQLLRRHQEGCTEAFVTLYDSYKPLVRWCLRTTLSRELYHAESDDLIQDIFLRLAKRAPALRTDLDLTRWLVRIARNVAISARRKRRLMTNHAIIDQL